jgi:hypothetical protein
MSNPDIRFDLGSIPEHVKYSLVEPLTDALADFYAQPGAEERFSAWLAEYRKRKGTR